MGIGTVILQGEPVECVIYWCSEGSYICFPDSKSKLFIIMLEGLWYPKE